MISFATLIRELYACFY